MNNKIKNTDMLPITGSTRHYPPAIREWSNSMYSFNKNYIKSIPSQDKNINKLIQNYFNLSSDKDLARSKRMRSRILRSTTKNIFLSKPVIKQTNDNINITVFSYNRLSQSYIRKMYFYNKHYKLAYMNRSNFLLSKVGRFNRLRQNTRYSYMYSKLNKVSDIHNNTMPINRSPNTFYKNNIRKLNKSSYTKKHQSILVKKLRSNEPKFARLTAKKVRSIIIKNKLVRAGKYNAINKKKRYKWKNSRKISFPYINMKLNNEVRSLFMELMCYDITKLARIKNMFTLYFLISLLSIFNLNPSIIKSNTNININILTKDNRYVSIINSNNLSKINHILWRYIEIVISNSKISNVQDRINVLFKHFYTKYFFSFVINLLKKRDIILNNYVKLLINQFKFSKFLPGLKLLIDKIYNKRTELNIINLKYPHLNSDIYSKLISIKLKKKVSLIRVLIKSLDLVRLPREYYHINSNINKLSLLNYHTSIDINKFNNHYINNKNINNKRALELMINKLYPVSYVHGDNYNYHLSDTKKNLVYTNVSKKMNILNNIKYKWVTGVRLEAAGRLTKRNTASRSMFKFRYKGNLKNIDYSKVGEPARKAVSMVMLRNHIKANSQNTNLSSKKRIGAFSIKSWISSY